MGSENEIVLLKWLTKNDYIEANGARTGKLGEAQELEVRI